jgi:hypothetical protein
LTTSRTLHFSKLAELRRLKKSAASLSVVPSGKFFTAETYSSAATFNGTFKERKWGIVWRDTALSVEVSRSTSFSPSRLASPRAARALLWIGFVRDAVRAAVDFHADVAALDYNGFLVGFALTREIVPKLFPKPEHREIPKEKMAGVAGLEPVTSAVTGQRSNQLSYTPEGERGR